MADNKPVFPYIDRPEISETFCDSYGTMTYENGVVKLELCVNRMGEVKPPKPPTIKKYTACRLAMTPMVAVEMFNNLQQLIGLFEQQGLVHKGPQDKPKIMQ